VLYDLTSISFPDSISESYTYDAQGNLIKRIDRGGYQWTYTHTYFPTPSYLIQQCIETNPSGGTTKLQYNNDGTLASKTDSAGNTTTYDYDALKRLTTITRPDGSVRTLTYDNLNHIISATDERGKTTTRTFDKNGNLTRITDPDTNVINFTLDNMDRIIQVSFPVGNPALITYDQMGRLKTMTSPNGNTITYGYDSQGGK